MAGSGVEVIASKGCSRLLAGAPRASFGGGRPAPPHAGMQASAASASASASSSSHALPEVGGGRQADGPFAGLVICVTGLSKEARKQVKDATERLGGQYSASLHPKCTHLVVQSFTGRKFEHALTHGLRNGLFVVTLGWFIDSVRRDMRLNESLYNIKNFGENGSPLGEFNQFVGLPGRDKSCLPVMVFEGDKASDAARKHQLQSSKNEHEHNGFLFSNNSMYIDPGISGDMKKKIIDAATSESAKLLDHWFIGCHATYVVCEEASVKRYVGHSNSIVTPLWILKTVKEKNLQRLVRLSSDLARHVAMVLENDQISYENTKGGGIPSINLNSDGLPSTHEEVKESYGERQKFVDIAKQGVRDRRVRRMQSCQIPIQPSTPTTLLDSICWSISEPTSSACIYTDSSWSENATEQQSNTFLETNGDGKDPVRSVDNFTRLLRESERSEVIFKNHFLTILFPVDRFGELGPSSRTFFSNGGFTCIQVLDHIYDFYQENMSANEMGMALHTDSRHADRLRLLYASAESTERGFVLFKRIDFLGSRRSFEALKRINRENNSNVYELVVRA